MPAKKRTGNPRESVTEELKLEMNERIGPRLSSIRKEHNRQYPDDYVTQAALAYAVGVTLNTMIRIEGGKTSAQAPTLKRIASYWGMSMEAMLGGIPSPTIEEILNAPRIKKILNEV